MKVVALCVAVFVGICAGFPAKSVASPRALKWAIKRAGTAKILKRANYVGSVPMTGGRKHPGFAASIAELNQSLQEIKDTATDARVTKKVRVAGGWLHEVTVRDDHGATAKVSVVAHRWLFLPYIWSSRFVKVERAGRGLEAERYGDTVAVSRTPYDPGKYSLLMERQNTYEMYSILHLRMIDVPQPGRVTLVRYKDTDYALREHSFLSFAAGKLGDN